MVAKGQLKVLVVAPLPFTLSLSTHQTHSESTIATMATPPNLWIADRTINKPNKKPLFTKERMLHTSITVVQGTH
jgi:hypothetical protein